MRTGCEVRQQHRARCRANVGKGRMMVMKQARQGIVRRQRDEDEEDACNFAADSSSASSGEAITGPVIQTHDPKPEETTLP